ncbi:MAG: hypothetical protein CME36_11950 [unclassified Hahellaceae]|nr:hypothetical protein [Hahellaceae bacterium]|tara:strand:+ start:76157 stop:76864 length:708 start_codon:yes stop_codon:yes gene_type:complete
MIQLIGYDTLGHANHGWLKARHHFSFANYYDPERMGFGALRVVNDDVIAAGTGFGTHPHNNMEIITYVRKGGITHRDSLGNEGRTGAGDVQVMSAGTGVAHSEYNREDESTNLYQIWIEPAKRNVAPRWEARVFPEQVVEQRLVPLASGRDADLEQGALLIHQDATISGGRIAEGSSIEHDLKYLGYLLVSSGRVSVNGQAASKGDALAISEVSHLTIKAESDSEVLLIDVPAAP